ncbi:hypothetical protein E2C01_035253 [Portunus trituberculatus]|uniref:Uncharacterized protein n=1 Tax=Portunus trituberculatus TaxID=210409 RepID=A0A5B7F9A1_PORTR|nr:hypothetical protein [Portunus trituberculatus]
MEKSAAEEESREYSITRRAEEEPTVPRGGRGEREGVALELPFPSPPHPHRQMLLTHLMTEIGSPRPVSTARLPRARLNSVCEAERHLENFICVQPEFGRLHRSPSLLPSLSPFLQLPSLFFLLFSSLRN